MIEIKDFIENVNLFGTFYPDYATNNSEFVKKYDIYGKEWQCLEDINGNNFWFREVKK